jgi:hypothetical protein
MDYKLRIIFLLLFIKYSYNLKKEPIHYTIKIIDNEMKSNHILAVNNEEEGYLYIITGEEGENLNLFKRYILKYDVNSGEFHKYFFNSIYPFKNPESTIAGYFSEFLLTTTEKAIAIYNGTYIEEELFNIFSSRRTLKNIGTEYYYAYTNNDNKNSLIITKMELVIQTRYNNAQFYKIIKTSEPLSIISYQEMISCDFTNDNQYILCAYISQDKSFTISVHNKYLELIQVEKKEVCQNFDTSYFIKIIYFKDNSKFITMNSENDYITRLRYFRYKDKNFINQLYSILDNNEQYLDIDETQQTGYNYNMDIIAVDSNKIVKVFASSDQIIITIFQFYEHETLLFIKIYNMKGYDYIGYNYLLNPRISIFRESMVVCLSAYYNGDHRAGYFFINYPNSSDIILTSNNQIIKIKDLISMENNLFSLEMKFKVLKVPKDFIFINLNEKEIKEDDILELNDELKLRQYRIKEGPYKLEYEGIAIGNDLQYSSSKVYPSYRDIPAASEIIIEGKESNIIINLDDCLEGYYHLDSDNNICTNIKPEGYYIDEEGKTYKDCEDPCRECSGPKINETNMNCISCIKGYNITNDTKSCYSHLPEKYYLDNDTFKPCHERCKTCFNGSNDNTHMNCLSCISKDYFYRKDTFNCITKNEVVPTEVITIKPYYSLYILFVLILVTSIIIAIIFLCYHCCPEQNQGNDYKKNGDIKRNNINNSIKPVKVQRENPDINAQKNDLKDENEMMLYINNKHSLNN